MNEKLIEAVRKALERAIGCAIDAEEAMAAIRTVAEHGKCRSCAVKDPLGLALEEEDDELPARSSTT